MITYPKLNMDSLGICASTLCMVHCLLFPLLLAAMPLLSLSAGAVQNTPPTGQQTPVRTASEIPNMMLSADSPPCCPRGGRSPASGHNTPGCCSTPLDYWFHVGMLATVSPLGLIAWCAGYQQHGRPGVIGLGLAGLLLLCAALLFGPQLLEGRGEPILTAAGSFCMVSAHVWNRRRCRCCVASRHAVTP